jgi:hypothetical protein
VSISNGDLTKLVAYLKQIDADEPSPSGNTAPVVTNPGNRVGAVGVAVSFKINATDAEGDALVFSASGLPAGLSINANGRITGTPTTAGSQSVTVTANDGAATGSTSFTYTINLTNDTSPPSKPGGFAISLVTGSPHLTWTASTDNVGVAGYEIHRSTSVTYGPEVARVTTTAWTDPDVQEGVTYTYARLGCGH